MPNARVVKSKSLLPAKCSLGFRRALACSGAHVAHACMEREFALDLRGTGSKAVGGAQGWGAHV